MPDENSLPLEPIEEEEGDFGFVLKTFVWGLLRTLLVVGGIGFLVWIIWFQEDPDAITEPTRIVQQEGTEDESEGFFARLFGGKDEQTQPEKEIESSLNQNTSDLNKGDETSTEGFFARLGSWFTGIFSKTPSIGGNNDTEEIAKNPFEGDEKLTAKDIFNEQTTPAGVNSGSVSSPQTTTPVAFQSGQGALEIATRWHEWIAGEIQTPNGGMPTNAGTSLEQGLGILRRHMTVFDVAPMAYVTAPTSTARRARITEFLQLTQEIINDSRAIQQRLGAEFDAERSVYVTQNETAKSTAIAMNSQIQAGQQNAVEATLSRHIQAKNKAYEASAKGEARRVLVAKLKQYDGALLSLRENMTANRAALENGVQVVSFPEDPFNRILTPAQWRALGTNE